MCGHSTRDCVFHVLVPCYGKGVCFAAVAFTARHGVQSLLFLLGLFFHPEDRDMFLRNYTALRTQLHPWDTAGFRIHVMLF
jgi:hypothetical protein